MTATISLHRTTHIDAKFFSHNGTHWVEISYRDGLDGTAFRVTAFFMDAKTARAYADAINSVGAEPVADEDGWIKWYGGECPVPDGTRVDVRFRSGKERYLEMASKGYVPGSFADMEFWHNEGSSADIVAYRIASPSRSEAAE